MKLSKFSDRELELVRESLGTRAERLEHLATQLHEDDDCRQITKYRKLAKECLDLYQRLPAPKPKET